MTTKTGNEGLSNTLLGRRVRPGRGLDHAWYGDGHISGQFRRQAGVQDADSGEVVAAWVTPDGAKISVLADDGRVGEFSLAHVEIVQPGHPEAAPAPPTGDEVREIRLVYGDRIRVPRAAVVADGKTAAAAFAAMGLAQETVECFAALYLDAKHRPIGYSVVHRGRLTGCEVDPGAVLAPAIRLHAAALVVAHNHPSGDCTPSPEDRALSERIGSAAAIVGIKLLDVLVIGEGECASAMSGKTDA